MRKQFVETVKSIMATDPRVVVILGDIGEYSFRDVFHAYPNRIYNVGINEQAMISMASGLAKEGFIPIVHTISPFLIERAYEQIKIDIGYQKRKVILVGCGGSYDYAAYGATHHSPADVALIYNVPGMDIYVPGHPEELITAIWSAVQSEKSSYIRISEESNKKPEIQNTYYIGHSGRGEVDVISIGNTFDKVNSATKLPILYLNKIPTNYNFDRITSNKIIIVEPYYPVFHSELIRLINRPIHILNIGVPRQFIHQYGKISDIDKVTGLTVEGIRKQIEEFLK